MPEPGSVPAPTRAAESNSALVTAPGRAAARRERVRAWVIPDLALVAAFATLFYCLFVFDGYRKLFRDADAGWHIRTGEAILSTGALPRTDPYSFTRAGEPWFAWEWGTDVLMGAVHRAGGLGGVALVYAAAIGAGVWLWFRLHWLAGGNFFLAAALAAPLLSTCNLHWLARPHVVSWIFLLAAVFQAERVSRGQGQPPLAAIAAASALWANLHASFFFAPALALLYGAAHFLHPLIWEADRAEHWRRARWFLAAAGVSAAATLATPYGWNLHRHVFGYLTDGALLARIGEFQSFDFHSPGAGQILLALGVAALGGALSLGQRRPAGFLLAAVLLALAFRSARALPVAALVLLPLANGAITDALARGRGLAPRFAAARDASLAYSGRLRTIDARLHGLALAPLVLAAMSGLLRLPVIAARTGFPPDQFPVAAAAEIAKLPAEARLLAPDKFGGYLIYRFAGARKVFFDGRSDLYGAAFLADYGRLAQVRPGWRAQLERFGFTHALLPNDYSLVVALEAAGWRCLYRDTTATLLEKGTS